eukprot:5140375-Pyramimonas_sp.AAC.1
MAMLPKGDEPLGIAECARAPDCLRPLSMENTDTKLIASAANRSLHAIAADTAHEQQGSVQGRHFPRSVAVVEPRPAASACAPQRRMTR